MFRTVLVLALALAAAASAEPSDSTAARPDSSWRNQAPRLYIQDETYADVDYIRTEITFVNYVRDPKEADIHLIVSSSTTGCGGSEYTLDFKGLGAFKDMSFALRHNTKADATSDESRTAMVAAISAVLPLMSPEPACAICCPSISRLLPRRPRLPTPGGTGSSPSAPTATDRESGHG